jgi:OFA family oxalate/formate antiporter-like MFS transporter
LKRVQGELFLDNKPASVSPARSNNRLYYGYVVLTACFFIMVLVFGSQISFGVFFKPILTEFGWSRAETAGPFALCMILSGFLTIVSGRLTDRFGPKIVVSIGGIILSSGYLLMSTITSLWQLYLYFGVLVAAGTSTMYVPLVSLIARWFTRRRGLMSGIGVAGIGFGIGVVPASASQLILAFNWRISLLIVGCSCLVLIVLLAQLLKTTPSITGLIGGITTKDNPIKGFSFREALRTRQFWMILFAWLFYGFYFQVGMVHIVPYATDLKLSVVVAATVLTIIGIVGVGGRICLGFISDRIGNRTTIFSSFIITGLAYFGLTLSSSIWTLYVFAVIFGAMCGIGILLIPLVAEYYGLKELGVISGVMVFANSTGGAISPPLAGAIFDSTGSYQLAFIMCGLCGIASGIIISLIKPLTKKEQEL